MTTHTTFDDDLADMHLLADTIMAAAYYTHLHPDVIREWFQNWPATP